MPENIYDQIASQTGGVDPAQPRSIYDDIADEEIQRTNQAVTQSISTGMQTSPDKAGEAQRLAAKVGVGPDIAQHDLEETRKQATLQDVQARDLASWNPILARQLSDPSFAAIAHDQVDNLASTGKLFQGLKDASKLLLFPGAKQGFADTASGKELSSAYDQGATDFELGMLGIKAKRGVATADDWQRMDELQAGKMGNSQPQTLIGRGLGGVSSMAGNILPMLPRVLAVGAAGAGVGAAASAVTGPGALAGAAAGFMAGAESEFGAQSYEMMAGNTYLDLLNKGVDEKHAQWASGLVGAANTALQLGAMRLAGKPVAGLMDRAFTRVMGESIAEEMTRPTVAKAVQSAVVNWGKNTALGATEMAMQTATSRMGEDWAKKMGAGEISSDVFSKEFAHEFGKAWVDAAVTMGVVNSFGSMVQFASESNRATKALEDQKFFENLTTNASESKVRERNPDSYRNYIQQQAESAGAENVYVDGQTMANVLHQSGLAVEDIEQVLPGYGEKIAEAAHTGGDVVIPTSQFATSLAGTDIGTALTPHLRLDPEAMSAAEAQEFQARHQEIFAEATKQATEQAAANEDFAKSAKVVENNIYDQLKATKTMPDDAARTNAQFVRDFVVTQAARQNMTPEAFFDKYRYTIQRAAAGDGMLNQSALDTNSEAFRNWFGDSKVVGDDGKPLVVYHGSPDARFMQEDATFKSQRGRFGMGRDEQAHWFTPSKNTASSYADERRAFDYQGAEPAVIPVHLKMENPLVVDASGKEWREAQRRGKTSDVIAEARSAGHDGVIIRNVKDDYNNGKKTKPTDTYVVFDSKQIKHATDNRGTFDPNDPNILHQSEMIPSTEGRDTTLHTPTGKMPAKYVLAEASDLIPSHDPSTFAKDARYPEGVQERAYDRSKEAQARVIEQAQNYEPAYTVNTNPDAVNGPPVITGDGIVLGGNSRTMSTIRLYRDGKGDVYRDALKRSAAAFGFTPEAIDQMKEPILVRRVDIDGGQDALRRLGTDLNRSMTGALGAAEKAVSAGKNIKPETLRTVSDMLQEGDVSLRELLAEQGPRIVQMMVSDGVITDRERPQYVDPSTGGLNDAGKTFVEKALLGTVIDDPRLMEDAPKSVLNKLERSLGPITSFSTRPDEWNIIPVVRAAVAEMAAIQRAGSTVDMWIAQASLFGVERNPLVDSMVRALDGGPNTLRNAFEAYGRDADANLPGQSRMFGSAEAFDAYNHAFGSSLTDKEFSDGLERAIAERGTTPSYADLPEASADGEGAGSVEPYPTETRTTKRPAKVNNNRPLAPGVRAGFDPSQLTAVLGQKSDMSSFLHETAHYFLTVYSELAKEPEGAPEAKADFAKLLDWFGVKDQATWDAMSLDEQRKYHEQFAYSYEQYLAEGKAPSVEAQGIFDRFTQWLKRVYKSVRDDINTIYKQQHGEDLPILTGEVKDVMDRMLASDEQIKQAEAIRNMEPVFKSQEVSGMNDAEWKVYRDMAQTATDTASQQLGEASVREMQWMSTAKGRLMSAMQAQHESLRESVRKDIRAELVKSEPVYKAQHFLRTGEMEGEEKAAVHKMDTKAVDALIPEGQSKDKLFGTTKRGGLDPDHVAAAMGFRDGKEMVEAILSAPSLKDATESATNQKMLADHGLMATPEGMRREVEKAVHNEARARLIAFEMRHAFNMTESERLLVKAAQQTARKMLSSEKFSDIDPRAYSAREARAARQAQAAAARGDVEGVGRAKRDQLLQNALTSEAIKVRDEADKHLRYLNKFDNPSTAVTKSIGADHMDAINELLAGYGLSPRERYSQRSESMEQWVNAQYDRTGVMPAVAPDLVARLGTMHWKDMTIDQLRDLRDAVKSIDYTGRRQTEITIAGEKATVDEIIGQVQDTLRDMKHTPVTDIRSRLEYAKGLDKISVKFLDKKSWIRSIDASLLKMEQLFQWIDAGKDAGAKEAPIDGPMQRVFRLATEAEGKEHAMRAEATKAMRELGEKLKGANVDLSEALDVPELPRDGDIRWYRGELISMALNMGNQGNKDKLLAGYGWSEMEATSAINRLMSKPEMDFVQGVWDHLASYGKEIVELERRQTGVMPQMVEPTPLATRHGVYPGGYYPVVYNDVLDYKAAENQARNADRLFENNFSQPATASGHTVARTGYVGPLYLSLGVIARHIDQVTHDLAWRESIIDMNKVLSDQRLMREIDEVYGRGYSKQLRPWLQAMANDRVFNTAGDSAWEGMIRKVRSNATMVGIGFRLSTMAIHGTSALSNSIGEVGGKWFAKGVQQFMGPDRIMATRDFVYDRSPEMAHRMDEADRNVHEAISDINRQQLSLDKVTAAAKLYGDVRKFAFRGVGMLDVASALPTWMGAYLKGMAKEADGGLNLSEDESIEYANRAVRNAHGGGGTKDLAAIQRSKGPMSLATMFYSYWNHVYNRQRDLAKGYGAIASGDASVRDFPKLLARSWFYIVVPQIAHSLLSSQKPDDDSLEGYAKQVAEGVGMGFVSGVPVLRDAANAFVHGRDYAISPLENSANTILHTLEDASKIAQGKAPSKRFVQNAAESAGYVFGLPLSQPAASAKFLWDVVNGNTHPKDISDWWQGLLTGKVK